MKDGALGSLADGDDTVVSITPQDQNLGGLGLGGAELP